MLRPSDIDKTIQTSNIWIMRIRVTHVPVR